MAVIATDDFTGTTNDQLSARTGWDANSGDFDIQSNALASDASGETGARYSGETWPDDQYAKATIIATSGTAIGLAVRCDTGGAATYYGAYADGLDSYLFRMNSGSWTEMSSGSDWANGDEVEFRVEGSSLTVLVNSVSSLSTTNTSITSGAAGVSGFGDGTGSTLDDWEGGDLTVPPDDFPDVAASASQGGTSSNGGSGVAITMPSGITAGDLLIAHVAGDTDTNFTATGWTRISNTANGTAVQHAIFAKIAAGSDTMTLVGEANDYAAVVTRIEEHGVSDVSTDIIVGTAATGSSSAPNPPNCDPGVSAKYLFLASFGADDDDDTASYAPTNYTGVAQQQSASSTSSCLVAVAYRKLEASSDDPGAFAMAATEEWVAQTIAIPPATGGTSYTITCDPGSFSITGTAANVTHAAKVPADSGSFALTGTDATLRLGYVLAADPGSVALTGTAADVKHAAFVVAASGAYVITGTDATIRRAAIVQADAGALSISGTAAELRHAAIVPADPGSLIITGTAADIIWSGDGGTAYTITCDPGSFSIAGVEASIRLAASIPAEAGAIAITGTAASVAHAARVQADPGAFSITGTPADIRRASTVAAEAGSLSISGTAAIIRLDARVSADEGSVLILGTNADILWSGDEPQVAVADEERRNWPWRFAFRYD